MAKRLKGWDAYVQEAKREPLELPLPDGLVITVHQPTGGAARRLNRAMREQDNDAAVFAIFGEDSGKKLLELFEEAPASVLNEIVTDVMREFDLTAEQTGDSTASSTSSTASVRPSNTTYSSVDGTSSTGSAVATLGPS